MSLNPKLLFSGKAYIAVIPQASNSVENIPGFRADNHPHPIMMNTSHCPWRSFGEYVLSRGGWLEGPYLVRQSNKRCYMSPTSG